MVIRDVIADVQQLLQSKFGKETTVRLAATHGVRVRLRGQALFGPLRGCDVVRKTDHLSNHRWSRYVHVPEVIWRSPKSVVREFLRGLFESDGSVDLRVAYPRVKKQRSYVTCNCCSLVLALHAIFVLLDVTLANLS